jgi:hypothetical protein
VLNLDHINCSLAHDIPNILKKKKKKKELLEQAPQEQNKSTPILRITKLCHSIPLLSKQTTNQINFKLK